MQVFTSKKGSSDSIFIVVNKKKEILEALKKVHLQKSVWVWVVVILGNIPYCCVHWKGHSLLPHLRLNVLFVA